MQTRRVLTALAGLALATALTPTIAHSQDDDWFDRCEDGGGRQGRRERARFCEVREQRLSATKAINVDPGQYGGVSVRAWDGQEILVRSRVEARGASRDDARALAGQVQIATTGGTIRATGPERRRLDFWVVSFMVYVPKATDLVVTTENGPIEIEGVNGQMNLEAENGPVSLAGVGGDVRARTQNGPIHVELEGNTWQGAGLDAKTINGPVELELPASYSAKLETGTVNGPIDIDFPITVTLQRGRMRHFTTTLGSGGPPVRVVTTNGPLTVRR